jgi:hypothetical protein
MKTLPLITLLAFASLSQGQVSITAKHSIIGDSQATYKDLPALVQYNGGQTYGIHLTTKQDRLILGLAYDYTTAKLASASIMGFEQSVEGEKFEAHTTFLTADYEFYRKGDWTAYAGIGAGATINNDTVFAWEARLGANRTVKDYLTIGLEASRRNGSTITDGNWKLDYPSTTLVGIKLNFNF